LYDALRKHLNLDEEKSMTLSKAICDSIKEESSNTEVATKDFVKREISESKNEMLKWFVGMFVMLSLMIVGLYFKK
jgi:hypothetical protein